VKKQTAILKQDKNLLKNQIWFLSNKGFKWDEKEEIRIWDDGSGFRFNCGGKPPNKTDYLFLLAVLYQAQLQNWSKEVRTTRHAILKFCGMTPNQEKYERLMVGLTRYFRCWCEWRGNYFDNRGKKNKKTEMIFGIINNMELDPETKELVIELNDLFIKQAASSKFFLQLDLKQLIAIKNPLASRLYELLLSMSYGRDTWTISAHKLATKLSMTEKYASKIIQRVNRAIKTIEKRTSLSLSMVVEKVSRGKAKLHFKINAKTPLKSPLAVPVDTLEDDTHNLFKSREEAFTFANSYTRLKGKTDKLERVIRFLSTGFNPDYGWDRETIVLFIDSDI
jgi:hypothetical protein